MTPKPNFLHSKEDTHFNLGLEYFTPIQRNDIKHINRSYYDNPSSILMESRQLCSTQVAVHCSVGTGFRTASAVAHCESSYVYTL